MTDEKTPEKIVLPRSGIEMVSRFPGEWRNGSGSFFIGLSAPNRFWVAAPGLQMRLCSDFDTAVSVLESHIMALRAALLAGAEEKVAQAMWTHDEWTPKTLAEADVNNDSKIRAGAAIYRDRARAVIAALCGEASK